MKLPVSISKKSFLLVVLFFSAISLSAQHVDTVIKAGIYKSYYCYALKDPLYVTYTLYKGGGGCDRDEQGFSFKKCGVQTASDDDYSGSGYDKGHLANAEDFADDCDNEEKTFCYYNCVPQTIKLNRGIWKTWEEKTRVLSQTKKLFVIAGAIYGNKTIGPHDIGVPDYCYKIVLENKTKKNPFLCLVPE
jgi:endonuclease G